MDYCKFKHPLLVAIFTFLIGLMVISGCTANTPSIAPPMFSEITPPQEITVDQLYAEYMADEAEADAKYKWKRLLFNEVEVEEVFGVVSYFDFGYEAYRQTHFTNGNVKFADLLDFDVAMQNIEVGYVLNIVGECRGLKGGKVSIHHCWVESVKGDLGTAGGEVEEY